MKRIRNLFILIFITAGLSTACNNNSPDAHSANNTKPDTNVNGAPDAMNNGDYVNSDNQKEKIQPGNNAANNMRNLRSETSDNSTDSVTKPADNPNAMQNGNAKMSGQGESGHVPASNSAPAVNTADTAKHKKQ